MNKAVVVKTTRIMLHLSVYTGDRLINAGEGESNISLCVCFLKLWCCSLEMLFFINWGLMFGVIWDGRSRRWTTTERRWSFRTRDVAQGWRMIKMRCLLLRLANANTVVEHFVACNQFQFVRCEFETTLSKLLNAWKIKIQIDNYFFSSSRHLL